VSRFQLGILVVLPSLEALYDFSLAQFLGVLDGFIGEFECNVRDSAGHYCNGDGSVDGTQRDGVPGSPSGLDLVDFGDRPQECFEFGGIVPVNAVNVEL
jgi:hypothetical protein